MTRLVVQVRVSAEQKARWVAAAGGVRGLSVWVRRALDDRAALDAAIARQAGSDQGARREVPPAAPASDESFPFRGPDWRVK